MLIKLKVQNFRIVVDGINSTGGIAVPLLLEKVKRRCYKIKL